MENKEHIYYNAINEALGCDYKKMKALFEARGTWSVAWQSISHVLSSIDPETAWQKLAKSHINLSLPNDSDYPKKLKSIPGAPLGLYWIGQPASDRKQLAIVGTRKATPQGKEIAQKFSKTLSRAGIAIISGLALGIDTASHEGCVSEKGTTLAVLGSGLNQIYPRQNMVLAEHIIENRGTLFSEYPIDMPALPHHFIERNRIVSGLADAVLVIEAPQESGSIITAEFALAQQRDVFVVPGPIWHDNYRGSNQLIKDGALLVTEPEEILSYFGINKSVSTDKLPLMAGEEQEVYTIIKLANSALSAEEIQTKNQISIAQKLKILTMLVVKGILQEDNGKYFIRNN